MKKLLAFILVFFVMAATAQSVTAATGSEEKNCVVETLTYYIEREHFMFEDGSYVEVRITANMSDQLRGLRVGQKEYSFFSASNVKLWTITLSASFSYNGVSCTCMTADTSVTIYHSAWRVISSDTGYSGNTATTTVTMGIMVQGSFVPAPPYTVTLSCDANGNLS